MSYIDIFIPLVAGFFCVFSPQTIIKSDDPSFEKKIDRLRKAGYILISVALLYALVKVFG